MKAGEQTNAALAERSAVAKQSAELLAKLRASAAKAPADASLASATTKASETLDLLHAGIAAAEQAAKARIDHAAAAVTTAERALADEHPRELACRLALS
jgi:hypothetical protein